MYNTYIKDNNTSPIGILQHNLTWYPLQFASLVHDFVTHIANTNYTTPIWSMYFRWPLPLLLVISKMPRHHTSTIISKDKSQERWQANVIVCCYCGGVDSNGKRYAQNYLVYQFFFVTCLSMSFSHSQLQKYYILFSIFAKNYPSPFISHFMSFSPLRSSPLWLPHHLSCFSMGEIQYR